MLENLLLISANIFKKSKLLKNSTFYFNQRSTLDLYKIVKHWITPYRKSTHFWLARKRFIMDLYESCFSHSMDRKLWLNFKKISSQTPVIKLFTKQLEVSALSTRWMGLQSWVGYNYERINSCILFSEVLWYFYKTKCYPDVRWVWIFCFIFTNTKLLWFDGLHVCISQYFITGRNEVLAKVIFSQASVILLTGGCIPACLASGLQRGGSVYPSMHCRWYHSMPCNKSTGRGCVSQHALQQVSGGCIPACLAAGIQEGGMSRPTPKGGNWGGSDPGPHPRGKLRGIRSMRLVCILLEGILVQLWVHAYTRILNKYTK